MSRLILIFLYDFVGDLQKKILYSWSGKKEITKTLNGVKYSALPVSGLDLLSWLHVFFKITRRSFYQGPYGRNLAK